MQNETEKTIRDAFRSLPESLKAFIRSNIFPEGIRRVSIHFALSEDDSIRLKNSALFLLCGLLPPNRYVAELASFLELDIETARKIAAEVNENVFRQVRDELKTLYRVSDATEQSKPLSAELEERVGLTVPEPPKPLTSGYSKKSLDAELSEKFQKPPLPPGMQGHQDGVLMAEELPRGRNMPDDLVTAKYIPRATLERAKPSFTPPQPSPMIPEPPVMKTTSSETAQRPSVPAPTLSSSAKQSNEFGLGTASSQGKTRVNPFAEIGEHEESLSRDEILRGIEDPTSIPAPSEVRANSGTENSSPGYQSDPYREPIQ